LQLVPEPVESVFGDLRGRRWSSEVDDQFIAVLRFAGGLVAVVEYGQASFAGIDVSWAISGEEAAFRYEDNHGHLYSRNDDDEEIVRKVRCVPEDWPALWRNIRDAVQGKAEPAVRPRETLRLMRVLDAVRRSSESGQVVAVQDEYAPDSAVGGKRTRA
jgi:predicted dehydrogenase